MEFTLIHIVLVVASFIIGYGVRYIIPDKAADVVIEKAAETVIKEETGVIVDLSSTDDKNLPEKKN